MKIKIKTKKASFSMPVPSRMARTAIKSIPDSVFDDMQRKAGSRLAPFASREMMLFMYTECRDILEKYKGLEMIHIESESGTFVSVKL